MRDTQHLKELGRPQRSAGGQSGSAKVGLPCQSGERHHSKAGMGGICQCHRQRALDCNLKHTTSADQSARRDLPNWNRCIWQPCGGSNSPTHRLGTPQFCRSAKLWCDLPIGGQKSTMQIRAAISSNTSQEMGSSSTGRKDVAGMGSSPTGREDVAGMGWEVHWNAG